MDNEFIVCVHINVDISNQLVILNPEWAMIYIYISFVSEWNHYSQDYFHYGNQSRGYFNGGRPCVCVCVGGGGGGGGGDRGIEAWAWSRDCWNWGGGGQRYWSVSVVTWLLKPGVSAVGVFRALQPNVYMFTMLGYVILFIIWMLL